MWLSEGDKNTKIFHSSTRQRRIVNRITKIKSSEGTIIEDRNQIATDAVKYYERILNNWEGSNLGSKNDIIANILKIIIDEQNKSLGARFSKAEVEIALMKMNSDMAPSADGFPTAFFQKCWYFISDEVTEALEGVINLGNMLKEINNTFFTLIPKKDKVENFDDFRPIALCNIIFKLLTKTLANRLKKFPPIIISEEQIGFVSRRSIYDGVIIA